VPPNLEFEVDDMEDVWRHKPFSFIHLRSLAGSLKDWPRLISQANENLEPGGWIEVVDFELYCRDQRDPDAEAPGVPHLKDAKYINMWVAGLHEAADKISRTFRSPERCKGWMEDVGFEKVVEQRIKVRIVYVDIFAMMGCNLHFNGIPTECRSCVHYSEQSRQLRKDLCV
tara:strand:- start:820 stop:1332 length:513 start_codon:yes stop_codon:yes gene_type:complete